MERYSDLSEERRGPSRKIDNAALNHFNTYLCILNEEDPVQFPFRSYAEITDASYFTKKLLNSFPSYLIGDGNVEKFNTCSGYLSSIKCKIERDHPNCEIITMKRWYTDLRRTVTKMYLEKAMATGGRLSDQAPTLTTEDLDTMCHMLFEKNTREAIMQRSLLTLQWQVVGRVSESSRLLKDDISIVSETLSISMSRMKVNKQQNLLVYLHASSWSMCPLHALACHLALNRCYDELFEAVPQGHESKYVNDLLAGLIQDDMRQALTNELKSHSIRIGSATEANSHCDIQSSWLVFRGGWTLDNLHTLFHYISGTCKTDASVGRVLSGWLHADRGGICPNFKCVADDVRELFRSYCSLLLPTVDNNKLRERLGCILVMYFHDIVQEHPNHIIIETMLRVFREEVNMNVLLEWSLVIKKNLQQQNSLYLPIPDSNGNHTNTDVRKYVDECSRAGEAMYKAMNRINVEELPFPTVEDRATSEQYRDVSLITKKRQRRRLINNEKDVVNA